MLSEGMIGNEKMKGLTAGQAGFSFYIPIFKLLTTYNV
jgi:hypothetical protein